MRAHQAASSASSAREKCMRPLVVGPSPVITPSRTTVRARAAVLRQEIFEGSTTPTGSASLSAGADIGTFLLSVSCSGPACSRGRKRGVNDSKPASRVFQDVLLVGRLGPADLGAIAPCSGAGAARKRQYRGKPALPTAVVFSPQGHGAKQSAMSSRWRRRTFPFFGPPF